MYLALMLAIGKLLFSIDSSSSWVKIKRTSRESSVPRPLIAKPNLFMSARDRAEIVQIAAAK